MMVIKLMVMIILVGVKMCDIGNSDSYYILSNYFKVDDSGDDYDDYDKCVMLVITVLMLVVVTVTVVMPAFSC